MTDPKVDYDNLEISFSCASGYPVTRYDWDTCRPYEERLRIGPEYVDTSRLDGGASVLKNHDTDKTVGKVLRSWFEDGRLCVRIKFRTDAMSRDLFNDLASGIVQNVSIGYKPEHALPDYTEDGKTIREIDRWTALEVSVAVGIPADPTVGFYRSLEFKHIHAETKNNPDKKEGLLMTRENEENPAQETEEMKQLKEKAAELEAENKKLKKELDDAKKPPEKTEEKECGGKDERQLFAKETAQALADAVRSLNLPQVTRAEQRDYSIANVLASMIGEDVDVSYERGVSADLYRSLNMRAPKNTIMVPLEGFRSVLAPVSREMNDTVGSGAGLVAQQNLPNMFVSYVRNKIGVKNATFIPGLTGGPVTIPAQTGDVTVAWVSGGTTTTNANAPVSETSVVVGDITLNPNKLGAYVDVGLDLLLMSNPYVTGIVVDSLLAGIAHKLGTTMLLGNASDPAITGLNTATGVQTATIADISQATWPQITGMVAKVDGLEYNGPMEWVMGAADKGTFKAIPKGQYGKGFICEDDYIDGRLVHIDGSLTSGNIFFGDFSNIIVGQWGGIELMLDPFTGAKSGKVCVIVRLVCDIGIRRPNTFVKRVAS